MEALGKELHDDDSYISETSSQSSDEILKEMCESLGLPVPGLLLSRPTLPKVHPSPYPPPPPLPCRGCTHD